MGMEGGGWHFGDSAANKEINTVIYSGLTSGGFKCCCFVGFPHLSISSALFFAADLPRFDLGVADGAELQQLHVWRKSCSCYKTHLQPRF